MRASLTVAAKSISVTPVFCSRIAQWTAISFWSGGSRRCHGAAGSARAVREAQIDAKAVPCKSISDFRAPALVAASTLLSSPVLVEKGDATCS